MAMKPSPKPSGTQAVSRALAILKAFAGTRGAWTPSDLARALGLHKTTTLRLLGALAREELLVRDAATGAYRLGPATITLGFRALHATDLRAIAHAELEALSAETGETVTLEVLVGHEVLIVDEVQSHGAVGIAPEVGTRWPAHATSTGKVLLAALRTSGEPASPGTRRRLERLTPRTITTADELERELDRVRRQGYATTVGELESWFTALAAPVRDHQDRVVAALSIGGPSERLTRDRTRTLVPAVQRAAGRITRQLGGRPIDAARAAGDPGRWPSG